MTAIHIPIKLLITAALGVDISHEGSAGRCFIGDTWHDHPNAHVLETRPVSGIALASPAIRLPHLAGNSVDLVIDEAVRLT
jgi:hypothetical protein